MTSTSFNVGLTTGTRNSSKVLKPPGGGSSDIFGTSGESVEPQRKTRTHLTSSIFGEESATPSRNKIGNDSFYNLFGNQPQIRPVSAFKEKTKSTNILDEVSTNRNENDLKKSLTFTNDEDVLLPEDSANQEVLAETSNVHTNGTDCNILEGSIVTDASELRESDKTKSSDGNPVASDGPTVNGASSAPESGASTPAPTFSGPAPAPANNKPRVPPGGFSSGLW
uniref:Microtubule-associated protein Jupiter n=1 Tax=Graphocephala atropunctata TaxID=36148 RepID=A0A1B6MBV5_9HEMI